MSFVVICTASLKDNLSEEVAKAFQSLTHVTFDNCTCVINVTNQKRQRHRIQTYHVWILPAYYLNGNIVNVIAWAAGQTMTTDPPVPCCPAAVCGAAGCSPHASGPSCGTVGLSARSENPPSPGPPAGHLTSCNAVTNSNKKNADGF